MIRLTRHAQEAIDLRKIELVCIEATVNSPDFVEVDRRLIITVHFDRGARR